MNTNIFNQLEEQTTYVANYEQVKEFGKNMQNRLINHGHVNLLRKAMADGALPLMPPITVNRITTNIIDGQHRRDAFIAAINAEEIPADSKIEVKIVNIPADEEIQAICNANVNSKNWSVDDFIESYAKVDINYQQLKVFCQEHSLCSKVKLTENDEKKVIKHNYRYGVAMLKGAEGKKHLKDGKLIITAEDIAKGHIIHSEVEKILDALFDGEQGPIIEGIAIVWYKYRETFTFKEWLTALKRNKNKIRKELRTGGKLETLFGAVYSEISMSKNK